MSSFWHRDMFSLLRHQCIGVKNKTKQTNKKQKDTWRTPCTSKYNREKLNKKACHNYDELLAQVSQQKLFKHTQTLLCLYSHGYLMQSRTCLLYTSDAADDC